MLVLSTGNKGDNIICCLPCLLCWMGVAMCMSDPIYMLVKFVVKESGVVLPSGRIGRDSAAT